MYCISHSKTCVEVEDAVMAIDTAGNVKTSRPLGVYSKRAGHI